MGIPYTRLEHYRRGLGLTMMELCQKVGIKMCQLQIHENPRNRVNGGLQKLYAREDVKRLETFFGLPITYLRQPAPWLTKKPKAPYKRKHPKEHNNGNG